MEVEWLRAAWWPRCSPWVSVQGVISLKTWVLLPVSLFSSGLTSVSSAGAAGLAASTNAILGTAGAGVGALVARLGRGDILPAVKRIAEEDLLANPHPNTSLEMEYEYSHMQTWLLSSFPIWAGEAGQWGVVSCGLCLLVPAVLEGPGEMAGGPGPEAVDGMLCLGPGLQGLISKALEQWAGGTCAWPPCTLHSGFEV